MAYFALLSVLGPCVARAKVQGVGELRGLLFPLGWVQGREGEGGGGGPSVCTLLPARLGGPVVRVHVLYALETEKGTRV